MEEEVKQDNQVNVASEVVSSIAGVVISKIDGVSKMNGGFTGEISEAISGKKKFSKGIKVDVNDKNARIEMNVIVRYGVIIPELAQRIQTEVKQEVEKMTGLQVVGIIINIQGIENMEQDETENTTEG